MASVAVKEVKAGKGERGGEAFSVYSINTRGPFFSASASALGYIPLHNPPHL